MPKLSNDDQRAIIANLMSESIQTSHSKLQSDREQALNFFFGRPLGNEIEGRSQVVSKDLMDVIEWMMPSLMRIFCQPNAVQFDPVGPKDEQQAKQETQYVNYVLWKKNPGFLIIYNWIKDGLMQKVGYVKSRWETSKKSTFQRFTGLSADQLTQLMSDIKEQGEVEVVGQEQDAQGNWDVKLKVLQEISRVIVESVQPDEIIVSRDCKGDVKTAKLVGHMREDLTRSDLVEMGYPKSKVDRLTDYEWSQSDRDGNNLARDTVSENSTGYNDQSSEDWAAKRIRILECYARIDADGDGIAELRRYLLDGSNDPLENEEIDDIPIDSWTPRPVPHRHVGLSEFDIMEDLQRIKTALQRGLLDNIYFNNNNRKAYNSNIVNTDSLQMNRPGGHIAVDGDPTIAIIDLPVNPMASQILPVIDYFDTVKETRTGVGRMTAGLDADVLAQSTKGAYVDAKSASNQVIEAIARIFAETGFSSLYKTVHGLIRRHQDSQDQFKLNDQWVAIDPSDWAERTTLTVAVGLGNSSREEVRNNLASMASAQTAAGQAYPGLVQAQNVFALATRMQRELGFENEPFFTDPKSPQYKKVEAEQKQPPPPDPYVQAAAIKTKADMQKAQIDDTWQRDKLSSDVALAITDMELKYRTDLAHPGIGAEVAVPGAARTAFSNGPPAPQQPGFTGGPAGQ